jgi:uncharacterized membrane protein
LRIAIGLVVWLAIGAVVPVVLLAVEWKGGRGGTLSDWVWFWLIVTVVVWVIARIPIAMYRAFVRKRELRRAERFECLKCGYPLKGAARDGKCPECGSPLGWIR